MHHMFGRFWIFVKASGAALFWSAVFALLHRLGWYPDEQIAGLIMKAPTPAELWIVFLALVALLAIALLFAEHWLSPLIAEIRSRHIQKRTAPASQEPYPNWPICDLFEHINPDFLSRTDDDVGDAWDKVGDQIRDQAAVGRLKIWGRVVRDGLDRILGQRQALSLIEPIYWKSAFFTYNFFDPSTSTQAHTYLGAGETGIEYTDLQVNRAQAFSIWQPSTKNALEIILEAGGDFEIRVASGLYKTMHTFKVSVKNNDSKQFLSNCKFYLNIADQNGQNRKDYALAIDPFTLNPTEEKYFSIVSYAEPASISGYADDFIQLHIPVIGGYYGAGYNWPWRLPAGAYAFSLFATSKESGRAEIACKIWVDDNKTLHFARA